MPHRAALYSVTRRRLRRFVAVGRFLSHLVLLLSGSILLARWLASVMAPHSRMAAEPGMAISTAITLFIFASCVLVDSGAGRRKLNACRAPLALALMAIALINALAVFMAPDWTVDRLLFVPLGAAAHLYMSPATALCVLLAGGCLLAAHSKRRRRYELVHSILAVTGLSVALLALTGYAFASDALQAIFVFSAMTFETAVGFFLLFASLLLVRPARGWSRILAGPGPGSAQLRRSLPFAVVSPFVFCWLVLWAVDAGLFDVNIRLSILAMTSMLCIVGLLFWSASGTNEDAAVIRRSNARLQNTVQQRDVLLKEVYHRVKNNLQLVDAMLGIETSVDDGGPLSQRLEGIRARVHAMALVHQQLVGSYDLATVDLKQFLEELCGYQAASSGLGDRKIRLEVRCPSLAITLERAIPIALVVAELVANAIKHGFPGDRPGAIVVAVERGDDASIVLMVADDGVGSATQAPTPARIGRLIVDSLVRQLGATMEVRGEQGYRVCLTIPLRGDG